MKLLIVDDSVIIRNVIESLLKNMSFEIVGKAGNGVEALEMFKAHQPDLVTMDITMPEMDGLTALTQILELQPEAKIIVVTALNSKAVALQAMNAGAKAVVEKPFNAEKLKAAIDIAMK